MYICKNLDGFCVVVKCMSCRTQCVQIRVKLKSDYTTGNMSDIDHNVNYEAEGPF